MRDSIAPSPHPLELALRAGLAPLLLGLRWAGPKHAPSPGLPQPAGGLRLAAKMALDEVFYASELVSSAVISWRDGPRILGELERALALFAERGWLDDPASYHPAPPPLEPARIERSGWPLLDHRMMHFESGYEPHPGEPGRERWLAREANRTGHVRLLEHRDRPRAWLVCVPAYRMGHPLVDFTAFRARWLHEQLGLNVAIPVMPLHGPRRAGRRGGDGFFSGELLDTVHAQAQAVWDVRRLVAWLRDQGAPAVGLYGISLGGYTAALVAGLEDRLACVLAGIPATDFARLFEDHVPRFLLRLGARVGVHLERISQLLHVVSPLALPPRVPRERRYLYAGVGDRLATLRHTEALFRHWQEPRTAWYQGGHVSFLWEPDVEALIVEALGASGLLPGRGVGE